MTEPLSPTEVAYHAANKQVMLSSAQTAFTEADYRAATFIETYTGRAFWPLRPTADAISILDIAHALSNQCRYTGHVRFFYSVAQHCVLLAQWALDHGASPLDALQILMHDAPEAYLVDIARPIKQYMPQYRVWDQGIENVIRQWMGWSNLPHIDLQHELDNRIIVDERAQLLSNSGLDWGRRMAPLGIKISRMTPEEAEKSFLLMYAQLTYAISGVHSYINHEWGVPVAVKHPTASDLNDILDVVEVDVRGGVAKIKIRGADGMPIRDPEKGEYPEASYQWLHGDFALVERQLKPVTA